MWNPSTNRIARFWRDIDKRGPDDCWPWLGTKTLGGYGTVNIDGWRTTAHRVVYALRYGRPINRRLVIMHSCDNPACCNPAHLSLGTQKENLNDMRTKGRVGDCANWGDQHGMCRIPDARVWEVAELYKSGMSQQKIADYFGVGQSQIGRILRGESRGARIPKETML